MVMFLFYIPYEEYDVLTVGRLNTTNAFVDYYGLGKDCPDGFFNNCRRPILSEMFNHIMMKYGNDKLQGGFTSKRDEAIEERTVKFHQFFHSMVYKEAYVGISRYVDKIE